MNRVVTSSLLRVKLLVSYCLTGFFLNAQTPYYTGTLLDDSRYDLHEAYEIGEGGLSLPKTYSLKDDLPKVGNQVSMPLDVGWAVAHATTILESRSNIIDAEVQFRSPDFVYMLLAETDKVCDEGISLSKAVNVLNGIGIPSIRDYREVCPSTVSVEVLKLARAEEAHVFQKVFNLDMSQKEKIDRIKRKISLDQPVIMAMHTPRSFLIPGQFWQPRESDPEEWPLHSMVIVGYDDNLAGGAFEVANSWGMEWGNDSFTWIRYSDFNFVRYAYAVSYARDVDNNYAGISGDLILKNTTTGKNLEHTDYDYRGGYQFALSSSKFDFQIEGSIDKPIYMKLYYKSEGEVSQVYPSESWRSSLFEYSHRQIVLPGNGNSYNIDDGKDAKLFAFISFRNIDDYDFAPAVSACNDAGELLSFEEYQVSNLIFWSRDGISFEGKMAQSQVIPLLIDLNFEVDR